MMPPNNITKTPENCTECRSVERKKLKFFILGKLSRFDTEENKNAQNVDENIKKQREARHLTEAFNNKRKDAIEAHSQLFPKQHWRNNTKPKHLT